MYEDLNILNSGYRKKETGSNFNFIYTTLLRFKKKRDLWI